MNSEMRSENVEVNSVRGEASATEAVGIDPRPSSEGRAAGGKGQERPKTVLQLIEYAYAEEGRRLTLSAKDMQNLTASDVVSEIDVDTVRRLAESDRLLAVPPNIMITLADLGASPIVRKRVLDFVTIALLSHPVFADKADRMRNADCQPVLGVEEISHDARQITPKALGMTGLFEFKGAAERKLHNNAVIAFLLLRVIRDRWPIDRFIDGMTHSVWNLPPQSSTLR